MQVLAEYVGGGDLGLHLRNGGLPLAQLREYTHQLVEALCYLHGKAVVHKDLRVCIMHMRCFQFVIRELKGAQPRHAVPSRGRQISSFSSNLNVMYTLFPFFAVDKLPSGLGWEFKTC